MKKQCRTYADFDLSRYHILSFDEMLKVNGGWGKKTSDDGSSSKSKDKSKDKGKSGSGRTDTKSNATSSKSSRGSAASQKDGKSGTKASSKPESGKKSEASANSKSKTKEVANTHEAVSKANVGDTVTRDDGTKVKLTKGDIDWAKDKCASDSGKQNSKKNSGTSSSSASSREKKESSGSSVTTGKTGKNTAQNAVKTEETPVKKNEQENLPVSENSTKNGNSQTENPAKVVGTEKTNPAESSEKTTCESATKQKVEETGKTSVSETGAEKTATAESAPQQKETVADSTQNNADAELAAKKISELGGKVVNGIKSAFNDAKNWLEELGNSKESFSCSEYCQSSANQNTSKKIIRNYGFGFKAAMILGVGFEVGYVTDGETRGIYMVGSYGCGVQASIGEYSNITDLLKSSASVPGSFCPSVTNGEIVSGTTGSSNADIGLGIVGSYDLNDLNKDGLPNSFSAGSIGGGVWYNSTTVFTFGRSH